MQRRVPVAVRGLPRDGGMGDAPPENAQQQGRGGRLSETEDELRGGEGAVSKAERVKKAMEMFDKIKHDIEQDYYREHYPNDGQRFIAWYLRNIHNLDIHEAKDCITDGAGDKQIDAIYI